MSDKKLENRINILIDSTKKILNENNYKDFKIFSGSGLSTFYIGN